MLKILYHIQSSSGYYYYCKKLKTGKCRMCAIPMIFCDFEKTLITICLIFLFLIRTIQNSALSLCRFMMRRKAVLIAFFTRSILFVEEIGQREKPGMSLSRKVLESIRTSKMPSYEQIDFLSLQILPDFFRKKNGQEYRIRLEEIVDLSLFENALNIYAFWQYK